MDNGLYTAYSGLRATSDMLDVVANNLANVNTTGFKSDTPFLRIFNNATAAGETGTMNSVLNDSSVVRGNVSNFDPGAMKVTGRALDVALDGKGFFVLQGPSGLLYTRNGNFQTTSQGGLVSSEGYRVLGDNGPIEIPAGGKVSISAGGEITVGDGVVDTLRVVDIADKKSLEKVGNASFRTKASDAARPLPQGEVAVRQGALEQSNVNAVKEMMAMISVMRQFEALQKTIFTMMNNVNDRSINQVGQVG